MIIDLQGFEKYEIKETDYKKFSEILNMDEDLLLDLIDLSKFAVPILCINTENVDEEGPKPEGHIITEIGKNRFELLKEMNS